MSENKPVRFSRQRRLVAACTTGVLALGALALSTTAQADSSSGRPQTVNRPTAPAAPKPTKLALPGGVKQFSANAATASPRYDVDGDGIDDQLLRWGNRHYENSLATKEVDLGISPNDVLFKDVLTPGDLDGQTGPEVLALTASGQLSLFHADVFPTGGAAWTGVGWQIYNKLVSTDDLNGDGKADIVARTPDGQLYLYRGTGNVNAPFASRLLIGSGWGQYDQLTGPGDLNGDGKSDLVARGTNGTLYFYAGTGVSTAPYAARTVIGTGWNGYNQLFGFADGGLWARTVSGDIYFYGSNGAGGFNARKLSGTHWNADLFAGDGGNPGYGKKELFGLSGGTLYWYGSRNNGTLTPRQQVGDKGYWTGINTFGFASSLTDQGWGDLLLRDGTNLWNLDSSSDSPLATGWGGYNLYAGPGDLNGDGKGDLLARDTSGKLYLFRGQGTGDALSSRLLIGSGWNAYNAVVGAGDFSGDGRADIVARTPGGTLYLYKGTGVSTKPFGSKIKIGTGWNRYNKLASPGDIDADGKADLVGVDAHGTLYSYSSTGTGTFKSPVKQGTGWNTYSRLF